MADSRERIRELFERLSLGDPAPLGPLYDALAPKIYGLALWRTGSSADAADVVQDVFLKLAANSGLLASVRHPLGYVFRMAHHACIDILRIRKREAPAEEVLLLPEPAADANRAAFLSDLIQELPAEQREAIYLRYFMGLSFREISAATGVSLFSAASRCRLAVGKLRRRLGEKK